MKKIALAFALSALALAACSSEATSVDPGSADTQTQADTLRARAVEFASNVTIDREGNPVVPADWTKVDLSVQSIAEMDTDKAPLMEHTEADLLGNGKRSIEMPAQWSCNYEPSYKVCCLADGWCCLVFPNGSGSWCHF